MQKYANTCGLPVTKVVALSTGGAVALLRKLQNNGKVFRVDFTKKDGTERTLVGRCGVTSMRKGGKAAYNFTDKGLLSVWEFGTGYRTVAIDRISFIKYAGVVYAFDAPAPPGEYDADVITLKGRTVAAETSPMYVV